MTHVLDEIDARIRQARTAAAERGKVLLPPLLALGISERVGSNWLSDTLRSALVQHNEPLRQQIGEDHPLSTLNPDLVDVDDADLDGFARHWLVNFAASKYATTGRHLVKETNLFFATGTLLRLLPEAGVVVLTRSPLGIASSFARGRLWNRWRYADRYTQLVATVRQPRWRQWAPLIPDDHPAELVALTRLVVLNTLLLAEGLTGRDYAVIGYEQHVLDPPAALNELCQLLPEGLPTSGSGWADSTEPADDTFTTTRTKSELVAVLDDDRAQAVRAETGLRLRQATDLVSAQICARAAVWLGTDHLYRLQPEAVAPVSRHRPAAPGRATAGYVRVAGPLWRNLLISNAEYASWLNLLHAAGLANTHTGTHLLLTPMPHERGGRIHFDPATGCWHLSPGYNHHPAYWVTWIGAAAYAVWDGARLPTHAELNLATVGVAAMNADYMVGDVVPVVEPGRTGEQVHHLVGNLQVWCADGPIPAGPSPIERYLHGAAWNTPGNRAEVARLRSRHLLGSSRGVGIRLVREDRSRQPDGVGVVELAARLGRWLGALADRDQPLAHLDQLVVDALRGSQTDVGLGPHVRPGTGEA